jgi:hypothetical protein
MALFGVQFVESTNSSVKTFGKTPREWIVLDLTPLQDFSHGRSCKARNLLGYCALHWLEGIASSLGSSTNREERPVQVDAKEEDDDR